jgi:hypothetical protein
VVANLRVERDRRRANSEDTGQLDRLLTELEPMARELHELATIDAIRVVITQHGSGPYPVEDMAAIAGVTSAEAHRTLERMLAAGLAQPAPPPGDTSGRPGR